MNGGLSNSLTPRCLSTQQPTDARAFKSRLKLTLIIIWLVLYNLDAQVNPRTVRPRWQILSLLLRGRITGGKRLSSVPRCTQAGCQIGRGIRHNYIPFYLIEVLMNGETETASLAQEKKKKRHEAWAGWDSGFTRAPLNTRSINTLELLQICFYILSVWVFFNLYIFFSHWSAGTGHSNCTNVQICCPLEPESTWY